MKKTLVICMAISLAVFMFAAGTALAKDKAAGAGAKDKAKAGGDQEVIQKVLDAWKTAAVAQDLDKVLALYSEKFSSFEYGDKAGLKKFIKDAIDAGYLKEATVTTANTKINVNKEKGTATATPVELKANFGTATIDLTLAKEKDAWMITGMEVQQY